jgi:hypothetical protein
MPNWCNNVVELAHEDPAMLERARDALNRGEFLNEFIPVPESLQIVAGRVGDDSDEAQKQLEADTARNIELHGYGNWYDYCVNEWGTKWDVGGDGQGDIGPDGTTFTASFDSAWSPPVQAYEKLLDLGFMVRAYYYEGGMGFAGIWDNGDDDFYDDLGDSKTVEETLPRDLDEMFCISECMREYEEENMDELEVWYEDGVEKKGLEPHKS